MGGGDLNLKKSWHPSTLRNIERVWKAEQKHEAEKQKIEQLQKELAEERAREEIQAFAEDQGVVKKRDERLDWMYQGPAALVNREEYLLGRKVDKTFELLDQQESGKDTTKDDEGQPGAIFSQSSVSTTVDLANKIREDPLFTIMKKEKEDRKTLLSNPVKMKQLQQLLKQSLSGEKKKKKKKKSKRKHKKIRHESTSSDSSSSDSEESCKNVKRQKRECSLKQSSSENGETIYAHSIKREKDFNEIERKYSREAIHSNKRSSSHYREVSHHDGKMPQFLRTSGHDYKFRESSDSRGYDDSENSSKWRASRDYDSRESSTRNNHDGYRNGEVKEKKKKLSSEDKERLRQEMLDNAKWREEQRQRNVQRYEREDEREGKGRKGDASEFIKPMLSKAASSGSIENRVRQKIFTIQRNRGDMDRNFVRR